MATTKTMERVILPFLVLVSLWDHLNCDRARGTHEGHTHYRPYKDEPKNLLKEGKFVRDYEHIKEDMEETYGRNFSSNLHEDDIEMLYFRLHDFDDNKALDGLELLAAMHHVTEPDEQRFTKEELENKPYLRSTLQEWWNEKYEKDAVFIDAIMREEDLDNDGYLSYLEFALGRQREHIERLKN